MEEVAVKHLEIKVKHFTRHVGGQSGNALVALCTSPASREEMTVNALSVTCPLCIDLMPQIGLDMRPANHAAPIDKIVDPDESVRLPSSSSKKVGTMVTLKDDDSFDQAINDIVEMNRKKRTDYATPDDIFANFRQVADMMGLEGFGPMESVLSLICVKLARLKALRLQGKLDEPSNESVKDTYQDLAVYSVILYALAREENRSEG